MNLLKVIILDLKRGLGIDISWMWFDCSCLWQSTGGEEGK